LKLQRSKVSKHVEQIEEQRNTLLAEQARIQASLSKCEEELHNAQRQKNDLDCAVHEAETAYQQVGGVIFCG
jgi:hypothetical protein